MSMAVPERPRPTIEISSGLEGHDDEIEWLMEQYEQLQLCSADVASPGLDLLTFSHLAHYFGLITLIPPPPTSPPSNGQDLPEPDTPLSPSLPPTLPGNSIPTANIPDVDLNQEMDVDDSPAFSGRPGGTPRSNTVPHPLSGDSGTAQNAVTSDGSGSLYESLLRKTADAPDDSDSQYDLSLLPTKPKKNPIVGMMYLSNSQDQGDYLRSGELNMGVIIMPGYRRRGYALDAVRHGLEVAFNDPNCYRVQAVIIDGPHKHAAMSVFLKMGFGHEGTRRRAFRSPYDSEFKDVTYLGILATDYVLRSVGVGLTSRISIAPASLWDELFARHQREREELLRWEDKKLKRSASTETIRESTPPKGKEPVTSSGNSPAGDVSGQPVKRRKGLPNKHVDPQMPAPVERGRLPQGKDKGKQLEGPYASASAPTNSSSTYIHLSDEGGFVMANKPTASTYRGATPAPVATTEILGAAFVPGQQTGNAAASSSTAMRATSPAFSDWSESDAGTEFSFTSMSSSSSHWSVIDNLDDSDFNYQSLTLASDTEDSEVR